MLLQKFIFPEMNQDINPQMYLKMSRNAVLNYREQTVELFAPGNRVSFDTYFNSFFAERWKKYTAVSDLILNLKFQGSGFVNICRIVSPTQKEMIFQQKVESREVSQVSLKVVRDGSELRGVIYFEYIALARSTLYSADFSATAEPSRDISVGLVITTFRREAYVLNNLELFERELFSRLSSEQIHVYVVDNGQTLQLENNEYVSLIPNGNFGGAGGFARGEMAVEDAGSHSHIVFCDDDAVYTAESFIRLIAFLRVAVDEDICVGGSMFSIDRPDVMYESGARYRNGYLHPLKNGLEVTKWPELYKLSVEEKAFSHAWWFFAFPCRFIKRFGYPMPFFFRGDDMEYSWRLREAGVVTVDLNGVCVWHEAFAKKSASSTDYYIARNESIMRLIHEKDFDLEAFSKKAVNSMMGSVAMYRYDRMEKLAKGYEDFLKGPECLTAIDPPAFHATLLKSQTEKAVPIDEERIAPEKYNRPVNNSRWKRLAMLATLNGALLPSFLMNTYRNDDSIGYVLEPMYSGRAEAVFRKERVMYLDMDSRVGYEVSLDRKKALAACCTVYVLKRKIESKAPRIQRAYQEAYKTFVTREFWERHLGIGKE